VHIKSGLLVLCAIAATVFGGSPASSAETVRLLTARPGWQMISPWYAKDLGLFAKHNVDIKHTALDSSSSVMEAFVSGQGDMALVNVGTAVNAYFRGVPLRVLAGTPGSDYPVIAANQSIKALPDIKGKKIAIWSVPNDASLAFDKVMKAKGLTAGTDYTYVRVPVQNICDTVKRDQADIGILFEPYASYCLLNGAHRVAPVGTVSFEPPKLVASSVLIVNADFMKKHPAATKDTLAALNDAVIWAKSHKKGAVDSLAKYSGQPADAVALSYDTVNFDLAIDRGYHDILLKRYLEAGMIKKAPSESDLKTLYQTGLLKR
jgi:ABC-type nitrate/sulfonate/bicarbonate transport system substrate-binding protein